MANSVTLEPITVRVVANIFILFVLPFVAVGAYWLGYSDGKLTGWLHGWLGDDKP